MARDIVGLPTASGGTQSVQITGSTVSIGGTDFDYDPPRTIYGTAANQPTAVAAHAEIPFAYYVSVDTQAIEQTDGSNWVMV